MNIYDQVQWNKIKTSLIISLFIVLIALLGYILGMLYGTPIVGFALAIVAAVFYAALMYSTGDLLILKTTPTKKTKKKK